MDLELSAGLLISEDEEIYEGESSAVIGDKVHNSDPCFGFCDEISLSSSDDETKACDEISKEIETVEECASPRKTSTVSSKAVTKVEKIPMMQDSEKVKEVRKVLSKELQILPEKKSRSDEKKFKNNIADYVDYLNMATEDGVDKFEMSREDVDASKKIEEMDADRSKSREECDTNVSEVARRDTDKSKKTRDDADVSKMPTRDVSKLPRRHAGRSKMPRRDTDKSKMTKDDAGKCKTARKDADKSKTKKNNDDESKMKEEDADEPKKAMKDDGDKCEKMEGDNEQIYIDFINTFQVQFVHQCKVEMEKRFTEEIMKFRDEYEKNLLKQFDEYKQRLKSAIAERLDEILKQEQQKTKEIEEKSSKMQKEWTSKIDAALEQVSSLEIKVRKLEEENQKSINAIRDRLCGNYSRSLQDLKGILKM